jgi:hypothetical protein
VAKIILNNDFSDLLRAFNEAAVEFLIVGAHALAFHGHVRATADFDIWVKPTAENASRVYAALASFGAPMHKISVQDFTSDDLIFQIGVAPIRIDVMTSISGVQWDDAWRTSIASSYGDLPVRVLGREALIANKRASARPQDLIDVEILERDTH